MRRNTAQPNYGIIKIGLIGAGIYQAIKKAAGNENIWMFSPFEEKDLYIFNQPVYNGVSLLVKEEKGQLIAEEFCVYFPEAEEEKYLQKITGCH